MCVCGEQPFFSLEVTCGVYLTSWKSNDSSINHTMPSRNPRSRIVESPSESPYSSGADTPVSKPGGWATVNSGRQKASSKDTRPTIKVTLKPPKTKGTPNKAGAKGAQKKTNKRTYEDSDEEDEYDTQDVGFNELEDEFGQEDGDLDAQLDELAGHSAEEDYEGYDTKQASSSKSRPSRNVKRSRKYYEENEDDEEPGMKQMLSKSRPRRAATITSSRSYDDEDEEEEEEDVIDVEDMDEDVMLLEDDDDRMMSRLGTPDTSKLTARQRAKLEEDGSRVHEGLGYEALDALEQATSAASRRKIHLTEEEQALKRAEMARRRKNMSIKRLEEEKQETLDKLLKKRASRSRKIIAATEESAPSSGAENQGNASASANGFANSAVDETAVPVHRNVMVKHPALLSWKSSKDSFTLSFEKEWVDIEQPV